MSLYTKLLKKNSTSDVNSGRTSLATDSVAIKIGRMQRSRQPGTGYSCSLPLPFIAFSFHVCLEIIITKSTPRQPLPSLFFFYALTLISLILSLGYLTFSMMSKSKVRLHLRGGTNHRLHDATNLSAVSVVTIA